MLNQLNSYNTNIMNITGFAGRQKTRELSLRELDKKTKELVLELSDYIADKDFTVRVFQKGKSSFASKISDSSGRQKAMETRNLKLIPLESAGESMLEAIKSLNRLFFDYLNDCVNLKTIEPKK